MWMRGGTSKGGYFLDADLPEDRDAFLMGVMGSPDPRQIDGMGGADPLTSKVAVVKRSDRPGIDVDYLFLQVAVDQPGVSDGQNCGNILAGVGPFAIERGLVAGMDGQTRVAIFMENTGQTAIATVETPGGIPTYAGDAAIDGVPGTSAPVPLEFVGTAGSTCGALLPTGNPVDMVEGVAVTMIDNGMPVVVLRASDIGVTGQETPRGAGCGHGAQGAAGGHSPCLWAADEPWRRDRQDGAQDDHGQRTARGWRDFHADVHSAPLPRLHRGLGCGERGDGLPAARQSRRSAG
jgi:4-oxalomesaconate tautomerase